MREVEESRPSFFVSWLHTLYFLLTTSYFLLLVACDFQGPWSYYPEETEVYQGIYTYGYIVAGESPHVCFSKVYALDENSAEDFAFYDSAYVTVSGKYDDVYMKNLGSRANGVDTTEQLRTIADKPNCFRGGIGDGIPGESYTLYAFFRWDSAGHKVETEYNATAKIPAQFSVVTITPPSVNDDAQPKTNGHSRYTFDFLGYPNDIKTYKFATEYDESVRGVLSVIYYDGLDGESMNTTMNHMLSAFTDPDSSGFTGFTLKSPEESAASGGFTARQVIAGRNAIDTIEFPGMTIPIGYSTITFYATDQAYADYENTVLQAIEDSRIVPKSNIENGMGVFSGMLEDYVYLTVTTDDYITYDYAKVYQCKEEDDFAGTKAWDTKFCRLYQESYCIDTLYVCGNAGGGLEFEFNSDRDCYSQLVKFAMTQDTTSWDLFLPDTISEQEKSNAYNEGLQHYCVLSNFESNDIADCSQLYEDCQVSKLKTECKEYEWQWCDDRNWDLYEYSQCGTALVSRYRLEEMNSSIIKRVIDKWCAQHPGDAQCE